MNEQAEQKQIEAGDERERLIAVAAMIAYNAQVMYAKAQGLIERGVDASFQSLADDEREVVIMQARYTIKHRNESADLRHRKFLRSLRADGFTYGAEYDREARTHPLCREWEQLEAHERIAMRLFVRIVSTIL